MNPREQTRHGRKQPVRGFTLLELAVALVVLGLMAALAAQIIPLLVDRTRPQDGSAGDSLVRWDYAVSGFSVANNRLPCPDTNGDGLEGVGGACGPTDQVGVLPFRSLRLSGPVLDAKRQPLRYGVYRNSAASADLATLTDLFEPALPDSLEITSGTVTGCATAGDPVTVVTYDNPSETTLRLSGVSGTFAADDLIGFLRLGFTGLTAVTPPPPSENDGGNPLFSNCPCGLTGATVCTTCPAAFTVGSTISGDTSDDNPVGIVQAVSGSTLTLFPGGQFMAGNTLSQLYTAPNPAFLDFQRTITNPSPPPATVATDNLLTGVSATATSEVAKSAHVVSVTPVSPGVVDLEIDQLPPSPFAPGDTVYSSGSPAASGTVVFQITDQTEFDDTTPESVSGPGGSATLVAGSDDGRRFEITSASCPFAAGVEITGSLSGTTATVVKCEVDASNEPTITPGSIAFTATVSAQTNELDFCQALRNGIAASGGGGSPAFVNTQNLEAPPVTVNPAYLLASGGSEDADGNGVDGSFDQRNEIVPSALDFESPARTTGVAGGAYDDVVASTGMQKLEDDFSCAENIGGVNALALDATGHRNLAEVAFHRNEQALATIDSAYRALELAKLTRDLKDLQYILNAATLAIIVYKAIMYPEGAISIVAVGAAIAALVVAVGDLFLADLGVDDAESTYEDSCTSQVETAAFLGSSALKASNALNLALLADSFGGVQ